MHEWCKITSDSFILDIVEHCHLNINVNEVDYLCLEDVEYNFSLTEQVILSQEISKLLDLKVIRETKRRTDQIISPVFLRKKKDGGYRMVLNLEKLNKHIPYQHFKMENFEQAIRLVNKGDYLASVDLKHAYYSVKIAEEQQKYLCFKWQGKVFQFTCLPNGISEGPRLFTKLMKPIFATLRERGFTITSFIDDTLMCSASFSGCLDCIHSTVELLMKLGFCVNVEKSVLMPTKSIEYLGNVIDSEKMIVTLPVRRKERILLGCRQLISKTHDRIREVARVIGLLVAAIPAVELGKLHYRNLESAKITALERSCGNFDKQMLITDVMKIDLMWWIEHVETQHRRIIHPGTEIVLYTDASDLGWGGCLYHQSVNGRWTEEEIRLHINARELKAVFFTLKSFAKEIRGKHIKVFCDNTTAVNYINEMGGTKSMACNSVCIDIWNWCLNNDAWITCSYIPGSENILADTASRKFNDRHEWKLDEHIFRELCHIFGTPNIDLFASRLNRQVPQFCSWRPDPETNYSDAFTLNWAKFGLVYIFPPFSLIARCLQKLRAEGAKGWMIVPLWTSQPWMGTLLRLLVEDPRIIMRQKKVLTRPLSTEEHPVMSHTRLMACLLSGKTYENEAYLRKVRTLSWRHGNRGLKNNTSHMSTGGHNFVLDGISIPLLPL